MQISLEKRALFCPGIEAIAVKARLQNEIMQDRQEANEFFHRSSLHMVSQLYPQSREVKAQCCRRPFCYVRHPARTPQVDRLPEMLPLNWPEDQDRLPIPSGRDRHTSRQ